MKILIGKKDISFSHFSMLTAITLLLLSSCAISFGQKVQNDNNTSLLTIEQAESIAVSQNLDVLSSRAQYESSLSNYLSAWSAFLPSASASASWRRYDRDMISFRNDEMFYSRNSYSMGLSASLPLFSGGTDFLSLKRAKLSRDAAWLSYLDKSSQIIADVVSYYLTLAQSSMELQIAQQALDRAFDEQKITDKKLSLGSASEVDASKMRVQISQKKLSLLQAQNNLQRNKENLCAKLNFPLDSIFDIDTTFSPPPVDKLPSLDTYLEQKNNRTVQQSELSLRSAELEKLSSYLNYLPKLSMSANWSWNDAEFPNNFSNVTDEGSFSYGLSLSWTLFSGTSRIAGIRSASANLSQYKAMKNTAQISAEKSIREAYRTMAEAAASYKLSEAQVADAKLTLGATQKRYEIGSATLLELLDAELALEQAQLQRISSIVNYYRAKAQLQWLTDK